MSTSTQHEFLSEPEAARLLGLKPDTLTVWRCRPPKGGAPAFYKIGRRIAYRKDELDAWLSARRFKSTTEYNRPASGRGAAS